MRCLELREWGGPLAVTERSPPEPGPTDVLIDVEATGVGRTVAHAIDGGLGGAERAADGLPRIPGHELVGVVRRTGPGVEGVEAGDRVTAYFHLACGRCAACAAGRQPLCENHAGYVGVDVDGGYAEVARLPARSVVRLPAAMDPVAATAIPDAIATPVHVASQRAAVGPDDEVMILGAGGGVGIHLVQVARHFGGRVTAVDVSAAKLERCADLGAHRTIDVSGGGLDAADGGRAGRYDAVVDFTGDATLVEAAIDRLAPRGTLVSLTGGGGAPFSIPPAALLRRELSVVGSRYCSGAEFRRAIELVRDGAVEPVVTERVGLAGVEDLLERIVANEVIGRGVMTPTAA